MPCSTPGPAVTVNVPQYTQPAPQQPGMPTVGAVNVTGPSTATVQISWQPVTGATYYKVLVNGQEYAQTATTYAQLSLTPGYTYQIAIAACN